MIRAVAFDFDGVLVESVDVKTRAFERVFEGESADVVQRIIEYHLRNGGISRFEKIRTIYREILKRPLSVGKFQSLCDQYARLVLDEVVAAPWVEGAQEFLLKHRRRYMFFVISGTPGDELKEIISRRRMKELFKEVLGSPTTKEVLLRETMRRHGLKPSEVIFIGDAESDWIAALEAGVKFIWRQVTPHAPVIPGFNGPCITSLIHLDACLETLES